MLLLLDNSRYKSSFIYNLLLKSLPKYWKNLIILTYLISVFLLIKYQWVYTWLDIGANVNKITNIILAFITISIL